MTRLTPLPMSGLTGTGSHFTPRGPGLRSRSMSSGESMAACPGTSVKATYRDRVRSISSTPSRSSGNPTSCWETLPAKDRFASAMAIEDTGSSRGRSRSPTDWTLSSERKIRNLRCSRYSGASTPTSTDGRRQKKLRRDEPAGAWNFASYQPIESGTSGH